MIKENRALGLVSHWELRKYWRGTTSIRPRLYATTKNAVTVYYL